MSYPATADQYGFLDKQLASLLVRLCAEQGHTLTVQQQAVLTELACRVSLATRAGTIALPLQDVYATDPDANNTTDSEVVSTTNPETGLTENRDDPSDKKGLQQVLTPTDIAAVRALPVIGQAGDYAPLIIEDDHIWLHRYHQYERRLADSLQQRLNPLPLTETQSNALRSYLDQMQTATKHNDLQYQAVVMAACSRFTVISGGPGTGKTTTVMQLLRLLTEQLHIQPQRILLAAPTGKAAMRLQESIRHAKTQRSDEFAPEPAVTLHRLLGYLPGKVSFRHNAQNRLQADVVIVDEASMIDIALMTRLFEAVPDTARLILLGDRDQLAAVETGSVFRDLCQQADNHYSPARQQQLDYLSGTVIAATSPPAALPVNTTLPLNDHIVVLRKSWRFKANSGIGQLSASIREGQEERLMDVLNSKWPDVHLDQGGVLQIDELQQAWQDYLQLLNKPVPSATAGSSADNEQFRHLARVFNTFNRFRILTPLRQGPLGTEQLNQRISQRLRSSTHDSAWFTGRPVMITRNDYRQNLFNGDIGLALADRSGQLRVWFEQPEGFRAFAPVRLPAHETAWAMTIHKSQGSEFDEVLLILPEHEDVRVLGRELLYTGVTRARQKITLLGKTRIIRHAMRRVLPPSSCLYQRLTQA